MSFVRYLNEEIAKKVNGEEIYEMIKKSDKLPLGIAIAFVKESKLHHHNNTEEWYIATNENPNGVVYLDGRKKLLKKYTVVYISPGTRHKLEAKNPRNLLEIVAVTCPPWSQEDHILDV